MSIRYLHREGTNEIEYAQGRIWSEIHELESDLAEKWALPDVYGERLLKNRGFALQSAKDAFRDKVGLDFKRLDALDVRRQETQLEKQIAKHGSHPTWATMMMSITIGSLVVAVGSVPLAGYAVYLGLHPVPPPPA